MSKIAAYVPPLIPSVLFGAIGTDTIMVPAARYLSTDKRRIILNLNEYENLTPDKISLNLNRTRGSFYKLLKNPGKNRPSPLSVWPQQRFDYDRRNVFRKARTGRFMERQLITLLKLPSSVDHARKVLRRNKNLRWVRLKNKPQVTSFHHAARLKWATTCVKYEENQ